MLLVLSKNWTFKSRRWWGSLRGREGRLGSVLCADRLPDIQMISRGISRQNIFHFLASLALAVRSSVRLGGLSVYTSVLVLPSSLKYNEIWPCLFIVTVATSVEELDRQILTMMRKLEKLEGWECVICGHRSAKKNDVTRHVEAKHLIFPGFTCSNCQQVYKTRNTLRKHICLSGSTWNLTFLSSVSIRSLDELESEIAAMMRKLGAMWECIVCGKSSKYKSDIRRHIESMHITSPGFNCDFCDKISPTREALRQHKLAYHKWVYVRLWFALQFLIWSNWINDIKRWSVYLRTFSKVRYIEKQM